MRSWLRHFKKCQFAELNWKPSPYWKPENPNMEIYEGIKAKAESIFESKLFKQSTLSQLLRQGEIDAVGACFSPQSVKFYACDIAFHSKGLSYGSKNETYLRIIKKIIRAALLINLYFRAEQAEVAFASPKVNEDIEKEITNASKLIGDLFSKFGLAYQFEIYCNENFRSKIIKHVVAASSEVEDTSELFLRSHQLLSLCGPSSHQEITVEDNHSKPKTARNIKPGACEPSVITVRGVKIHTARTGSQSQKYLFETLSKLLLVLAENEKKELQDKYFCNEILGLNYPLLTTNPKDIFDKEHRRYYQKQIHGFHVCNHWYENNFAKWSAYLLELTSRG